MTPLDKLKLDIPPGLRWSGGGQNLLDNALDASRLYPDAFSPEGRPLVLRNVAPSQRLISRDFILIPQNAWAWHGPASGPTEQIRRTLLRASSDAALKAAHRVVRIGPMIPTARTAAGVILPNVLDNGFEDAWDDSWEKPAPTWIPDAPYFIQPGSLWSYRNTNSTLDAFNRYVSEGGQSRLLIVGPVPNSAALASLCERVADNPAVTLVSDRVERWEILTALRRADLALFPSLVEASPVTLLEAAAVSTPIAAWDTPAYQHLTHSAKLENVRFCADAAEMSILMHSPTDRETTALASRQYRKQIRNQWALDFVTLCSGSESEDTPKPRSTKIEAVSKTLGKLRVNAVVSRRRKPNTIRVVNYHHVPEQEFEHFKRQVDHLLQTHQPVDRDQLDGLLRGTFDLDRAGILFTFDDGFESQATYVADYLKASSIRGVFFVPTAAPNVPRALQPQWALDHQVLSNGQDATVNGRVFADWNTWRRVVRSHAVASHTHEHVRFGPQVPKAVVRQQLESSFETLERELGAVPRDFCWVGGETNSYSREAAGVIRELEVEIAFTTCSLPASNNTDRLRIERTNLESSFSLDRVEMTVSGLIDLRYRNKRRSLDPVLGSSNG